MEIKRAAPALCLASRHCLSSLPYACLVVSDFSVNSDSALSQVFFLYKAEVFSRAHTTQCIRPLPEGWDVQSGHVLSTTYGLQALVFFLFCPVASTMIYR